MNITTSTKVLALIRAAYPNAYSHASKADIETTIKLWASMFEDRESAMLINAVKTYIATDTSGFPPTIGQIKNTMFELSENDMTAGEAWATVRNCLRNCGDGAKAEFEKLPIACQKVVGSPAILRNWAYMNTSSLDTVVASQFVKNYAEIVKMERAKYLMPPDVKQQLGYAENYQIEYKGENQ